MTAFAVGFPALAVAVLGLGESVLHRFARIERAVYKLFRFPPI